MSNITVAEHTRWILGRALRLNTIRKFDVPYVLLNSHICLLDESVAAVQHYVQSIAQLTCALEIEACKQSSPCYFCGHLSHDDLDDENIPVTRCLKGHNAEVDAITERSKTGCIDHDPKGAILPISTIDEDIVAAKERYAESSVNEALALIGAALYRKCKSTLAGCVHCATTTEVTTPYCAHCGRLLKLED